MNICNDNHEDIAFESLHCPLCELRESLEETIKDLTSANESIQLDLDDLLDTYNLLYNVVKSHAPELLI